MLRVTQGRSERMRETSPPPGSAHRTLQPVASRYADYAMPTDPVFGISEVAQEPKVNSQQKHGPDLHVLPFI